jgi:hypothetical protein
VRADWKYVLAMGFAIALVIASMGVCTHLMGAT